MVVIRMTRVGRRKAPTFRLIVQDKNKDPWGSYVEIVGNYDPRSKQTVLKEESIKAWLAKGAQPSDSVHNMFVKAGIIKGEKKNKISLTGRRRKSIADEKQKAIDAENARKEAEAQAKRDAEEKALAEKEAAKQAEIAAKEAAAAAAAAPTPSVEEVAPTLETPATEEKPAE